MKTKINDVGVKTYPYRGYYHYKATVKDLEIGNPHSDTIQDQSYSIKDILEKFTRTGETLDSAAALYQGEESEVSHESADLRQVMAMDLVDRDELITDVHIRQQLAAQRLTQIRAEELAAKQKKEAEEKRKTEDQTTNPMTSEARKKGSSKYEEKSADSDD